MIVRLKLGIVEYCFSFEDLEELKNEFRKNGYSNIGREILDNYDGRNSYGKVKVEELSMEDIEWSNDSCNFGIKYLRGWKS